MSQIALLRETVARLIAEIERLDPTNMEAAKASGVMSALELVRVPSPIVRTPKPPRQPTDRDRAIAAKYGAGATLLEVAAEFKVARNTARDAIVRCGVSIRSQGQRHSSKDSRPNPKLARMIELRSTGMNLSEIGAAVGLTRERVRQVFVKAGIPTTQADAPLTEAEKRCVEMYLSGDSLSVAAEHNGLSENRARAIILRSGHKLRRANRKGHSEETLAKAQRAATLYNAGWVNRRIAEELGLPKPEMVYRLLAIAGAKANRHRKPSLA
jgi:DNA-binding CsgD family transcriptional regulator